MTRHYDRNYAEDFESQATQYEVTDPSTPYEVTDPSTPFEHVVEENKVEQPSSRSTAYPEEEEYQAVRSSTRTRKTQYSQTNSSERQNPEIKAVEKNQSHIEINKELLNNAIKNNQALRKDLALVERKYFGVPCYDPNNKIAVEAYIKEQKRELDLLYKENEDFSKKSADVAKANASQARQARRDEAVQLAANPVQVAPANVHNVEAPKPKKWTLEKLEKAEGTEQVELTAVKGASNEGHSYSKAFTEFKKSVQENILAPLDAQRIELEKRIEKGELSENVRDLTRATIKEIETTIHAIISTVIETKEVLTTEDAKPFDQSRLDKLTFAPNETHSSEQIKCASRADVISHQQKHIAAHINNIMLTRDSATTKNRDSTVRELAKKLVNFLGCVTIVPVLASAAYSQAKYRNFENILFFSPTNTATVAEKVAENARSHNSASPPPVALNNK